ncbi:MAG: DUF3344 domain-containing protein, partial [Methanoregula sp.]|nr:DUF3344 domain-containing protein [Methanoregula sp.]
MFLSRPGISGNRDIDRFFSVMGNLAGIRGEVSGMFPWKKSFGRSPCIMVIVVLVAILAVTGIASANEYEGGIPLQTVNHGVVSGGLYYDSYPGFATSAYKSFSLPSHTTIEWARVYVGVYSGHKQNNYHGTATVNLDTNGDGTADVLLGNEDMDVPYTYPGEGGTGPVSVG